MNETQAEENPLSQDFDIKSLLKFAFPTIVMMLLMGLYTIVDTIFVARFVGPMPCQRSISYARSST